MEYGYTRISTRKQDIERQVRNIQAAYPDAVIVREVYTGTKIDRPQFDRLLTRVKSGDAIIFDSVSRMSRNAEEGIKLYQELYNNDICLVFLKEPHINTDTYRSAIAKQVDLTGSDVDLILTGINQYLLRLAARQIEIAFEQAQKEVDDLHKRTAEGIETARLNGKQIGQRKGAKLHVKKKEPAMRMIMNLSRDFNGSNTDPEVMKIIGISRNTYYKYKRELRDTQQS